MANANDASKYKHGKPDPVWIINPDDLPGGSGSGTSIVEIDGFIDEGNSSTDTLGAGLSFDGTPFDMTNYAIVYVTVFSDVASATNGLSVQQSPDGVNWDNTDDYTVPASTGKTYSFQCGARWFRIVYTNGGSGQGAFRLQVIFKGVYGKPSTHKIQDTITSEDDSELVKAVITGQNAAGDFVNFGDPFPFPIQFGDSAVDAFGRQRVASPFTIFDSKQHIDNAPLFWDDQEISGSGTSSAHSEETASTDISVSNLTAGKRERRTFRRFNYEPGKSQLILMTFGQLDTSTGITKIVGYGDDDDGLFLVSAEGTLYFRRRTNVTGSPVDTDVAQSAWNVDKLDGTGGSGITLDDTTTQILFIDFEWLGVGRVRFGFVIDGRFILCHELNNANSLTTVYMSSANQPLTYSIENDGTGAEETLSHICTSVVSEGGANSTGKLGYVSTSENTINANTAGTIYALVGLRLKTTGHSHAATVNIEDLSVLITTNDNFEWLLILNPTMAVALTWSNVTNYAVQMGLPDFVGNPSTTTVTNGTVVSGGYGAGFSSIEALVNNALVIGTNIAGVADRIVLCVRPLTSNTDVAGGMIFRELS